MEDRERALEQWFDARGLDLYFDDLSLEAGEDSWLALAIPHGSRIGSAAGAHGSSRVEAAEALRAELEAASRPPIEEIGQTVETDTAMPITARGGSSGAERKFA